MLRETKFTILLVLCQCAASTAERTGSREKEIAEQFAAKVVMSKIVCDPEGRVVKLALSNHSAFRKDKALPVPAGVSNEEFQQIVQFERLDAIFLEMQPLSDASMALLKSCRLLKDVRLHYVAGKPEQARVPASADFPLFINELPGLKVLELKHNFSIKGGCMDKLRPQPELEKLELDTGYCTSAAATFISAATKLRNLQLHRTTLTDADFQTICKALPELEVLEVRPHGTVSDPITGRSLRGLKNCSKLQVLHLSLHWKELPFEGGLDALVPLKQLQQLTLAPSDLKSLSLDSPEIQALHRARPDILIRIGGKSLGGKDGQIVRGIDDGYDWGGTVTTHG